MIIPRVAHRGQRYSHRQSDTACLYVSSICTHSQHSHKTTPITIRLEGGEALPSELPGLELPAFLEHPHKESAIGWVVGGIHQRILTTYAHIRKQDHVIPKQTHHPPHHPLPPPHITPGTALVYTHIHNCTGSPSTSCCKVIAS